LHRPLDNVSTCVIPLVPRCGRAVLRARQAAPPKFSHMRKSWHARARRTDAAAGDANGISRLLMHGFFSIQCIHLAKKRCQHAKAHPCLFNGTIAPNIFLRA
jgi:hypothetical protein